MLFMKFFMWMDDIWCRVRMFHFPAFWAWLYVKGEPRTYTEKQGRTGKIKIKTLVAYYDYAIVESVYQPTALPTTVGNP